ncbi:hypothetical protein [Seonamhaeicola sp. ML3]|uniref:hypothetical protein n=1 Tax=Seonamhaeicola sp. ML3 TaxID=2937786 RepID=UPI00200C4C54|nr:hypothetical protein [Seonamhaeicola sp. ML3]
MKKNLILLIIVITIIFSCSSTSVDNTDSNNDSTLNPPEWIRGVWLTSTWIDAGYEFSTDDFCFIELCDKSCIGDEAGSFDVSYEEEITESYYSFAVIRSNSDNTSATRTKYEFEKISDTEIKRGNQSAIHTKQQDDWVNCSLFDENTVYPLNNEDAFFVISVPNAPARARVTLEIHFKDGSMEKSESNPNSYIQKAIRIDKEATKAVLTVKDLDNLSGIDYTVIGRLYNSDYSNQYFVIYEEDIRGVVKTIFFE